MRRLLTSSLILCLGLGAATATAPAAQLVQRGTQQGQWRTGDFSAAELVTRWGYGDSNGAHNDISVDAQQTRDGQPAMRLSTNAGFDNWVYFPNTKDLDLNLTGVKVMHGFLRSENANGWGGDPWIIFVDMAGKQVRFDGQRRRLFDATKDWTEIIVPVGANLDAKCAEHGWKYTADPAFDWRHVACVQIHQDTDGYGYVIWYSGFEFVAEQPTRWWFSSLDMPDIAVTYAEQLPPYRRCFPTEPDPKHNIPELVGEAASEKHWPDPGEKILYRVHIKNAGAAVSAKTNFVCKIDGQVAKTADIPALAPKQEMTIDVPWSWKQGPYQFIAQADTKNAMCELTEKNNALEFKTDAYMLAAVCEKDIVAPIEEVNNWYGSFCFEDWVRGATVDQMNQLFQRCRYECAPEGANISVRVGQIILVDKVTDSAGESIDKTLKLDIYDGVWHYDMRALDEWRDLANDFDWALVHELTHQLGVIDNYQYDLGPDSNLVNHKQYERGPGGIMGGGQVGDNGQPAYADVDIAGMNLTRGHRRGFYGEYLYCLPMQNTLVLTLDGKSLPDTALEVYQKDMQTGKIDTPAICTGTTDARGLFPLANRPVPKDFTTATGCALHANPFGYPDVVGRNGLFLIRAQIDGRWYYSFLDIGRFVVQYALGHRESANYVIRLQPEG
jgi:hypothetical protein